MFDNWWFSSSRSTFFLLLKSLYCKDIVIIRACHSVSSRMIFMKLSNWTKNPTRLFQHGDCFQETALPGCCREVASNVISCPFQIKHKPIMKPGTKYPIVLTFTTDTITSRSFLTLTAFLHNSLPAFFLLIDSRGNNVCGCMYFLCVFWGCRVSERWEHSNPSNSGELSELIGLYHLRTEVQVGQSWALCIAEDDGPSVHWSLTD